MKTAEFSSMSSVKPFTETKRNMCLLTSLNKHARSPMNQWILWNDPITWKKPSENRTKTPRILPTRNTSIRVIPPQWKRAEWKARPKDHSTLKQMSSNCFINFWLDWSRMRPKSNKSRLNCLKEKTSISMTRSESLTGEDKGTSVSMISNISFEILASMPKSMNWVSCSIAWLKEKRIIWNFRSSTPLSNPFKRFIKKKWSNISPNTCTASLIFP